MDQSKNLHEGHRARMMEKFINYPDALSEHELLEVLLFGVIPRVDTNGIAHRIINTFGSLSAVFNAEVNALMTVQGVGKKIAVHIYTVGKIMQRVIEGSKEKGDKPMFSLHNNRQEILNDFNGLLEEKFIIYFMDKKFRKITKLDFEQGSLYQVSLDVPELAKAIAIHKPKFALIAHNHPSGSLLPSINDDLATKRVHLICAMHNVDLVDHVIVAKGKTFSYYHDGNLAEIKETANLEKLLR
jgi:DNA repair protein RadC